MHQLRYHYKIAFESSKQGQTPLVNPNDKNREYLRQNRIEKAVATSILKDKIDALEKYILDFC